MASTGKVDVTVRGGGFDVGEKVAVTEKHGDNFLPGTPTVETATVNRAGEIELRLEPGRYWVHRLEEPFRQITVHAKHRDPGAEKPAADTAQRRLDATRPITGQGQIITGAVNTTHVQTGRQGTEFANSRISTGLRAPGDLRADLSAEQQAKAKQDFDPADTFTGSPVGHPTPKGDLPHEPVPALAQEDVRNAPQRSATVTGQAHPVDPGEILPKPRQDQVPKGQPQRSATPLGEAAPIHENEATPAVRQEDARGIPQRSATDTGAAVPKPPVKEPEATRRQESSTAKAEGGEPQQPAKPAVRVGNPLRGPSGLPGPRKPNRQARQSKAASKPARVKKSEKQ